MVHADRIRIQSQTGVRRMPTQKRRQFYFAALVIAFAANISFAGLEVTVATPQISGQKAIVKLGLRNTFTERIESARAVVFLLDEQGKMIGQSTKWVIGGSKGKPGLAVGATNIFHFVIVTEKPLAKTNVTAKITFSRVVLEGGKLADAARDVQIQSPKN